MNPQDQRYFDALFAPRTVALIGASADPKKHTYKIEWIYGHDVTAA